MTGIYKITNTLTRDCYVGSSKNIEKRWHEHKRPSEWRKCPNNRLYIDMQKHGTDAFSFEILEECDNLFEREQYWMDVLKPTYNSIKSFNKKKHGISGVYIITCTVTGDFYIGSSVNVKRRWVQHKCPSIWKHYPKNKMYQDMQKYGIKAFRFELLAKFPQEHLKRKEQEAVLTLHPSYNSCDAYTTEESFLLKRKAYKKAHYEAHKEEYRARKKSYNETHKEELKAKRKAYAKNHKEELKAKAKAYYESHKEELKVKKKSYAETHKEELKTYLKAYREAHKDELDAKKKAYYEAHKDKIKAKRKAAYEAHKKINNEK